MLLTNSNIFVGSLPRPPSVLKYLENNHDDQIPSDVLDTAVSEIVKKQIDVGVTIVGDGKFFQKLTHK